jgi:hypothetical protein
MFSKTRLPWCSRYCALTLAAGLACGAASASSVSAADGERYIIPATDGYGISDCLHGQSDCGRVMADSWCEAHGHAHAIAYGTGEDITGATPIKDRLIPVAAGDVVIRCGD